MAEARHIAHIIHESTEDVKEYKVVGEKNNKPVAEGYLQTDLKDKNRNGRIYGVEGIKKEVEGSRIQDELIPTGNMKGHDGHPSDPSMAVQQTIDPKLCSVKYLKIWMEGDNVKAQFTGTNNHLGQAFNQDLLDGEKPSFSLRAIGSVVTRGGNVHVENVKIVTWDRVYYPSHKKAYTTKLLTESTGMEANIIENSIDLYNRNGSGILIPVTTSDIRDLIKHESGNIHRIIESFDVFFDSMSLIENGRSVQLVTKEGDVMIVALENYVTDQIMGYCSRQ